MLAESHQATPHLQGPPWASVASRSQLLSLSILDHLKIAIAVLDTRGTVLFYNVWARQLAQESDRVDVSEGRRLRFLNPDADQKLRAALRRLAEREQLEEDNGIVIVANGPDACEQPLIASLGILSDRPDAVLVVLAAAGYSPCETSLQCLMQAFHLTPAEQRLTRYLAFGGCLSDAAGSFAVSRHTVRNQLRSIFEKVGVQRQTDLMRLMLTGSARGGIAQI